MDPGPSTAATSETATSEVHADRRNSNRRDAACQTDDPFPGPEESGPATKTKPFESREQTATTGTHDEPFQGKAKQSSGWWSRPAAGMPDIKAVAAKLLDRSRRRKEVESRISSAVATVVDRPLPIRLPPLPKNASLKDVHKWNTKRRRIDKLNSEDPRTKLVENLPILRKPKDPDTRDAVASSRDKEMVLHVARSIVSVSSSIATDGNFVSQYTGIVVGWDEAKKCARILTSYHIAYDTGALPDPKPKIHVRLPNKIVLEGQLRFFNKHYNIALLEITADFPLQLPSFGSSPNYGQEVFALARDEDSFLLASHGTIVWIDAPDYSSRNYPMFLSCELPGDGGAAIDHNGNVIGMTFYSFKEYHPMLVSISTILTCIEMWMKFSRIARPIMEGLHLRSVELLDVSSREEISYSYNIDSGYIVDMVRYDSTAEKAGIRRGDVIVSFDELGIHPLPKLEDLLLSLGWEFLERGLDASTMVDFKLEVYDPIEHITRSIILPVGFCDAQD